MKFRLLQESLGFAVLQLAVPVAAAGGRVQAQELLADTHILDVSDGVVPLAEQLQRDRIYTESFFARKQGKEPVRSKQKDLLSHFAFQPLALRMPELVLYGI